jgi:AraC-like DNA-binding protein
MQPSPGFEMIRRAPSPQLAGILRGLSGYREHPGFAGLAQQEAAPLVVPLVISLGTPFQIALGRSPDGADGQPSFAAGLYAGPVHIRSDGRAECLQIDFTPTGAFRVFGGAVRELAACMVDLRDLFGVAGTRLRDRLGETACWHQRFDLAEAFIAGRVAHDLTPEVAGAWRQLAQAAGDVRIEAVAAASGWSRKRLAGRFQAEIGLGPKTVGRMLRFHRACGLARAGEAWASVAAACGYADQAHLARDFVALAGEGPTAWARRLAALDARLDRPAAPTAGA